MNQETVLKIARECGLGIAEGVTTGLTEDFLDFATRIRQEALEEAADASHDAIHDAVSNMDECSRIKSEVSAAILALKDKP